MAYEFTDANPYFEYDGTPLTGAELNATFRHLRDRTGELRDWLIQGRAVSRVERVDETTYELFRSDGESLGTFTVPGTPWSGADTVGTPYRVNNTDNYRTLLADADGDYYLPPAHTVPSGFVAALGGGAGTSGAIHIGADTRVVADGLMWTPSGSGVGEHYLEADGGGDPGIAQPGDVLEDGAFMVAGTAGSLANGEWAWADNDSLGFRTLYVRLDDESDPDTHDTGYVTARHYTPLARYRDATVIVYSTGSVWVAVGGSIDLSDAYPAALGSVAPGTSRAGARADHVHPMPSPYGVGAVPTRRNLWAGTGLSGGGDLTHDRKLAVNFAGSGSASSAARSDHGHALPDLSDVDVASPHHRNVLAWDANAGVWVASSAVTDGRTSDDFRELANGAPEVDLGGLIPIPAAFTGESETMPEYDIALGGSEIDFGGGL